MLRDTYLLLVVPHFVVVVFIYCHTFADLNLSISHCLYIVKLLVTALNHSSSLFAMLRNSYLLLVLPDFIVCLYIVKLSQTSTFPYLTSSNILSSLFAMLRDSY